jgi:phenylacetate-CoA ligase
MNRTLLRAYHAMPSPIRTAAASLHGLRLRRWRYGPDTEELVAQALERDTWSAARWAAWQEERGGMVLARAAAMVPYYRERWAARRRSGDRASPEVLGNWPVLTKEELRRDPRAFVADDCDLRAMYHEHTSGTSGTPLDLWWSRSTVRAWYALFEARVRRWHGVSRHDRWANLGGQLVAPASRRRPPFGVWNAGLNQLYLSTYHLAGDSVSWYLEALERSRVRYLFGYSSALDTLARLVVEGGHAAPRMTVAISNAEPLLEMQRSRIEKAFGCSARETYGMTEIVAAATECAEGRLHLWPDVGITELRDEGAVAAPGATGAFVCTGLINADMPLIRYAVGDRGTLGGGACPCGRLLPMLASVDGRSDDVLRTRDGRWVGRLDPVFKAALNVREAQVVQESLDSIRVRIVAAEGFGADDRGAIADGLRLRLGDVRVSFEEVASIPRTANGKLRAVISNLAPGAGPG